MRPTSQHAEFTQISCKTETTEQLDNGPVLVFNQERQNPVEPNSLIRQWGPGLGRREQLYGLFRLDTEQRGKRRIPAVQAESRTAAFVEGQAFGLERGVQGKPARCAADGAVRKGLAFTGTPLRQADSSFGDTIDDGVGLFQEADVRVVHWFSLLSERTAPCGQSKSRALCRQVIYPSALENSYDKRQKGNGPVSRG
jgi:hypothetical protein